MVLPLSNIRQADFLSALRHADVLDIPIYGRLGNNILQLINAVAVSHFANLERINYDYGQYASARNNISYFLGLCEIKLPSGLTIGASSYIKSGSSACHVADSLMDSIDLDHLVMQTLDQNQLCRTDIHFLCDYLRDSVLKEHSSNQIDVLGHLRGEDVFGGTNYLVPRGYTQPPYSFYLRGFKQTIGLCKCEDIYIQAQDRCNPVVDHLYRETASNYGSRVRLDLSSFHQAVCNILSATHLISSRGTFVPMLSLLSEACSSITFFRRPEVPHLARLFSDLGKKVYLIVDNSGRYTPEQEWINLPFQRKMMSCYPEEFLSDRFPISCSQHIALGKYEYV